MRPEITGKKVLPLEERFGVTVAIAAEFSGISKSSIYELLASGNLAGRIIAGRMIGSSLPLPARSPRQRGYQTPNRIYSADRGQHREAERGKPRDCRTRQSEKRTG